MIGIAIWGALLAPCPPTCTPVAMWPLSKALGRSAPQAIGPYWTPTADEAHIASPPHDPNHAAVHSIIGVQHPLTEQSPASLPAQRLASLA